MAVTTRDRRFSLMGFGLPVPKVMANPVNGVAAADRAQLLYLYNGIVLDAGSVWTVQTAQTPAWSDAAAQAGPWTVVAPQTGGWT